jgi:hypothetical protein
MSSLLDRGAAGRGLRGVVADDHSWHHDIRACYEICGMIDMAFAKVLSPRVESAMSVPKTVLAHESAQS